MLLYVASFAAVAVSAAQDLFEIVAPAAGIVKIHEIELGQYSDYGDAASEGLSLLFVRGHSTSGSGGSAFTALPTSTKFAAAASTCEINNTTIASAGTGVNVWATAFNVQAGYGKIWTPETRLVLRNSERGVFRLSAPADALTMNGTVVFSEE